jgi:hypothetical protein
MINELNTASRQAMARPRTQIKKALRGRCASHPRSSSRTSCSVSPADWDDRTAKSLLTIDFRPDISFELPAPSTPSVVVLRLLPSTPLRTVLLKVSKHLDPSLAPAALHKTDGISLCRSSGVDDEGGEELEGAKRTLRDLGVEPNETLRVVLR